MARDALVGSNPWKSVTAYDPDVLVALARAQAEVFERGEFGFQYVRRAQDPLLAKKLWPDLPAKPPARSIEEAREQGAESGTCSVLDVYGVGAAPAPAIAGPFAAAVLQSVVGTDRPTLARLEAALRPLFERLKRGDCAYVICYAEGRPSQYLFIGMSFD